MQRLNTGSVQQTSASGSEPPLVSVVVPVFRHAALLDRALASILAQDYAPLEIIVVDDGPDDDVARVVAGWNDPRIRLKRHSHNRGAAAARNTGVAEARGAYIAFLDADDEWHPDKLRTQIAYMTGRGVAVSTTGFEISREGGPAELRLPAPVDAPLRLVWGCDLSTGSTLVATADLFRAAGGFHVDLPRFEDWDWLLRVAETQPIAVVGIPLARINVGSFPSKAKVDESCRLMKSRHGHRFKQIGRSAYLKFAASLLIEQASASLSSGKPLSAALLGMRSLAIWPFRNRAFFRRSFRRVAAALFRSPGRRKPLSSAPRRRPVVSNKHLG